MANLGNVREHVCVQRDGLFAHSDKYVVGVFTLRERPDVHWPYIEKQLLYFMQLTRLRGLVSLGSCGVGVPIRVQTAIIALYNYFMNVKNSLPCRDAAHYAKHRTVIETIDQSVLKDIAVCAYAGDAAAAWYRLSEVASFVNSVFPVVGRC